MLHSDLVVAQVVVAQADLVPGEAERHRERVADRKLPSPCVGGDEVGVFGKLLVERRLGRRDFLFAERHAVDQRDDALRDRVHVVQRRGPEPDRADFAPVVLLAVEVALQHHAPAADDEDAMLPPHPLVGDQLVEARREIIGESGLARLGGEPWRAGRSLRERRAGRQRKAACNDLAAIEADSHAQPSAPPAGDRPSGRRAATLRTT